ncbi:MAG: tetratricopeptide repeat protein, partial [Flavobacteriaceae bacterium]|nr:tetratricopeptide repeat protein [Flavobacteriaceae bacterium]
MRHLFLFLIVNSVFFLYPVFSQESVDKASLLPFQSPVVVLPQAATGTTDSLKKAESLMEQNRFEEALSTSLRVLDQVHKQQDEILIYNVNDLIAKIFLKSNNFEKALEYYHLNRKLVEKTHDSLKIAKTYASISSMYAKTQKYEEAEFYSKRILNITNDSSDFLMLKAIAYSTLSAIYVERKQLELAEMYIQKSLAIQKKTNDKTNVIYTLNSLGSVYLLKNDYYKAKRVYFEALKLSELNKDSKYLNIKEVIYDNLSYALFKLKDYNAFTYQEKSFNIRDSLRDNEISRILGEIEGKYNTENIKKEAQLKTSEEVAKRKHTQDINIILILVSLLLTAGIWMSYRYFKLRQEKLKLEL